SCPHATVVVYRVEPNLADSGRATISIALVSRILMRPPSAAAPSSAVGLHLQFGKGKLTAMNQSQPSPGSAPPPPCEKGAEAANGTEGELTSVSLLERAKGRDEAAWRRLVLLYSPLVYFWARRSGLADTDAADVVQDVWQRVAAALPRFRRDSDSGTFR